MTAWSFLTNHALVLAHLGQRPASTGLEVAQAVGITERAVRKIVADLQAAGYIESERVGRRNQYRVEVHRALQEIGGRRVTAGELLTFILRDATGSVPAGERAHVHSA